MPVVAGNLTDQGAIVSLTVGVSRDRKEALVRVGFPVPAEVQLRAVIDSGSAVTAIQPDVFRALDLTRIDEVAIHTPSTGATPHHCDRFHVSLSLVHEQQELLLASALVISSMFRPEENLQGLIGRDVLDHCLFVYDGKRKQFSLAF